MKTPDDPSHRDVLLQAAQVIIPGLNGTHVHFIPGAFSREQLDLGGLNTLGEVPAAIRRFVAANPGTGWLQGRGWLYTPFPGAWPTRAQL